MFNIKRTLLILAVFSGSFSFAQNVGVGTTSPAAKLDVTSTNSGILIPRIALTGSNDATTVPSPATSTLIYNTATMTGTYAITPGFYYWNGSTWVKVLDGTYTPANINIYNTDGTLTGTRTMTMAGNTLYLNGGTLSTSQDASIHGVTVGEGGGSQSTNTALGAGALTANTSGTQNSAVGYNALHVNTRYYLLYLYCIFYKG
jgi:hypothetical protein